MQKQKLLSCRGQNSAVKFPVNTDQSMEFSLYEVNVLMAARKLSQQRGGIVTSQCTLLCAESFHLYVIEAGLSGRILLLVSIGRNG